jgi:uncharacterized membrane protein YagU involved in acid resistance
MSRILIGVLGGIGGTIAMTAFMRRLHKKLPPRSRYPLPPREIVHQTFPATSKQAGRSLTTLSHFGYGAAAGALFAVMMPRRGMLAGATYGAAVWAASYLGWIPAVGILTPATRHPRERNVLMIAAHLVWGGVLGLSVQELDRAEHSIFRENPVDSRGPVPDAADMTRQERLLSLKARREPMR